MLTGWKMRYDIELRDPEGQILNLKWMKQAIIRRSQFTGSLYKRCRKARYFLQWFAERVCTELVQAVHRDT